MKYCVVFKKENKEERTRFSKHETAKKRAKILSEWGFKTLILSKNDFESTYGVINKPPTPARQVTDMSLLAGGFQDGPPFYNMNHRTSIRGFMFSVNKPRMAL